MMDEVKHTAGSSSPIHGSNALDEQAIQHSTSASTVGNKGALTYAKHGNQPA